MTETSQSLRRKLEQLKGSKAQLERQAKEARNAYIKAHRDASASEEARAFLQQVAEDTQNQFRYHITELGSMALTAVFGEEFKLDLIFEAGKASRSADLVFLRGDGKPTHPLNNDSGGAANIASFALRPTLWTLQKPRTRPFMAMDEPAKDINDPTRRMHQRYAETVKEVSRKLGIQFLIVTAIPELEEIADHVIRF